MKPHLLVACSLFAFAACKKAESKGNEPAAKPVEAPASSPAPAPEANPEPKPEPAPAPAVVATSPTAKQASDAVRGWLDAIGTGDATKVAATLDPKFQLIVEHSHPSPECADGKMTSATAADLAPIAGCMLTVDFDLKPLKKEVTAKSVNSVGPTGTLVDVFDPDAIASLASGRGDVYVTAEYSADHYYSFSATVAMIDGAPKLTGAYIGVELVDD